MVKAKRPATAGVSRPPPVPIIAVVPRPPSAAAAVSQSSLDANTAWRSHQSPMLQGTKVRPLSAFRVHGGWSSVRSNLSWNDSAILHTEDASPFAVRRRAPENAAIPFVLHKGGSMRLEDISPSRTPLYTALKANLPSGRTNAQEDSLPGVVADDYSTNGQEEDEEVRGLPMRISELIDEDQDRGRVAEAPIRKAALLDEGTQTHVENRPRGTQTEFSVSLVSMIENALTSATGDMSPAAARRRSLPAAMDPSALSSLLKPPLHPPPRGDLVTELPNLSETRQTPSEIEQSQPEIQRELDAETASVGTGVQTAELSEKSEGGREGGREERREGGTPTQAINAPHPSLSHKLLMPPVVEATPAVGNLDTLPEIGPSLEREAVVLKLSVVEAAELAQSKVYGLSDPYCIVHVEGTTKRTRIVPSSQDPKWDEEFRFCLQSFYSPVSLAVMDKHAARENKLMGVLEFVPGELLAKVCDGPEQTTVEADAWVLLQNKSGIPGGGRVLLRLATSDFRPTEKKKKTSEGVFRLTDLANDCLSKHDVQIGDETSPLSEAGNPLKGKQGSGIKRVGSIKSSAGHRQAVAAILEDPADLIDLFEGQKPLDEGCEQGYYSERSLYLFDTDSLFRHRVFRLVSAPAFHAVSWIAAVLACFAMGLDPQPVSLDASEWTTLEFVSYAFLGLEIILKSIAFGFAEKSQSFIFSAVWNVIDLVAFLSYAVEYAMPRGYASDFTLRPFRFFRILSPLAQFEVFTGLTTIFLSLKTAFWPFATVIAFLLLFFIGFGVFGVSFYHHSYSRRCVNALTREIAIPNRWCKIFTDGTTSCPASEGQECVIMDSNELGSVINFDYITNAFVSIFQAISLDGQPDIMNKAVQGEPKYAALGVLFFLLLTFFCRFLLFNLCVAVITTTFQQVRRDVSAALDALHSPYPLGSTESISAPVGSMQSLGTFVPPESSPNRSAVSHQSLRRRRTQGLARRSFHDITLSIVNHPLFETVAMACVLVNTIAMARQAVDISPSELTMLSNLEIGTQCLFVVELLIRMLGANSLPEFFSRGHDKFDFFVILLTGMCLFARIFGVSKDKLGLLATFSALRFIRLVSIIPSINHLLTLTLASVTNIINLLFFTFSFFSVYAVCAVFIFGSNPDDIAHQDYANYGTAMSTLFAIFIGDDWRMQLYRAMQHGIETSDWWRTLMPCGFVLAFFFFSQAVLVNLYIAVIIENFSVATTQDAGSNPKMLAKLGKVKKFLKTIVRSLFKVNEPFVTSKRVHDIGMVQRMHSAGSISSTSSTASKRSTDESEAPSTRIQDRSFFYFSAEHPVRTWCQKTAHTRWFQTLILFVIFLSMLALAIEPPTRDIEPAVPYAVLDAVNYVSTVVFLLEFFVQAVSLGLLFAPEAYFKSAWNCVDFLVLILSLMDILGGNTKSARVLRLGRALRPLRLIKRNQGMRLMLDALLATWKPVSMIVILAFAVATIFAIMGMSLFKGRFSFCNNPSVIYPMGRTECVGNFFTEQNVMMPSAWDVPAENFDSFTRAMMQCLTMNTMQWADLMRSASDVTEPGKALVTDGSTENLIFLVIYLVIGGLFVTNLFVAFIIDGFNQLRKVDAKNLEKIANYDVFLSLVRKSSPHRQHALPTQKVRVAIAKHVLPSSIFEYSTTLCVFLNVFFLALYHPGRMSDEMQALYDMQNNIFFALMVLEAGLIIAGKGWFNYLEDRWNWIDIVSIIATFVAFFLPESAFIRSFRLVKILRIIKNVKALQAMFETLARAIPQFTNVMLLLFLILTMFAILCVNLFGLVREGPLRLGSCVAPWPSIRPTFKSYPVAMYTLFLITQGEDWNLLVYDTAVQAPYCTEQFEGKDYGDCGIPVMGSFLIFFAFKLVAEFVLINLFVGMIIDTFTSQSSSHVAVQFNFDVRANTHYVKHTASKYQKRGSVVKATSSEPPAQIASKAKMGKLASYRARGSSRRIDDNLSCAECWKHMTNGGGRHDFILIPDVQVLMRMLPQPLGFARDALGVPTMTSYDRAICKLIWAELNILATQRSEGKSWRMRSALTLRRWLGLDVPIPSETGQVTFDETFLTLFHWRCPELVPEEVRKMREPMLEEVVKTAHAVSISRHIRRWLALCKLRKEHASEDAPLAPGAARKLMLIESHTTTQQDMQRNVEGKKIALAATEVRSPMKMSTAGGADRLKKIHGAGGVGALRRTSSHMEEERAKAAEEERERWVEGEP